MQHMLLVLFFGSLLLAGSCHGQLPGKDEKAPAIKESLPFIQCQVCQNLMRETTRNINKLRDDLPPGKVMSSCSFTFGCSLLPECLKTDALWTIIKCISQQEGFDGLISLAACGNGWFWLNDVFWIGQLKEIDVMESLEKMCDPESDEGDWISKTDLQVVESQLKLVDMEQVI